jgi:hypothetical protein
MIIRAAHTLLISSGGQRASACEGGTPLAAAETVQSAAKQMAIGRRGIGGPSLLVRSFVSRLP